MSTTDHFCVPHGSFVSTTDHSIRCIHNLKFGGFIRNEYIMRMNIDAFWKRVKQCLKDKAVTQNTAAKAIGIPSETFRGWMSKGRIPPLSHAFKLSNFLGVSLEFLITGKEQGKI